MKNSIFGLTLITTTALVATNAQATFEEAYKNSGEGTYTFSGDEDLSKDLGKSNHNMVVTGNNATLHGNDQKGMELQQGRSVTVHDGLNFEGFKKNGEGAVLNNSGTFELEGDANFSNNSANWSGGVFYNKADGTITLKDGEHTFENNNAGQPNTGSHGGGVLYNEGTFEMSGTNTFKDNKADRGFSGAIHNVGQVTLEGTTTFEGNYAKGMSDLGRGGAVSNHKDMTITGDKVTFRNNKSYMGGAVYNDQSSANTGVLNIETEESEFSENKAETGGGAISNGTDVNIGGHATFKGNEASSGGAIENKGGNVKLNDVVFDGNTATAVGGAIYNSDLGGGKTSHDQGIVIVEGTAEFSNNEAETGSAIYNVKAYTEDNADVSVTFEKDVSFSNNTASNMGGAVYNSGTVTASGNATFNDNNANYGGAVLNYGGTVDLQSENEFNNNTSTKGGGALYNWNKGTVKLGKSAAFSGNTTSDANGGAVYNDSTSTIEGQDLSFSNNTSSNMGGAVYNAGTVTASGHADFNDNHAKYGGAVLNYGGTVDLQSENEFNNNTSTNGGGAIYNWNGTVKLGESAVFSGNNTSDSNGGAVYNDSTSTIEGRNLSFSNNTSSNMGGAVYNAGTVTASGNAAFEGNQAKNGGAVYNSGTVNIESGKTHFSNNTATDMGGAVYNKGTMTNTGHTTFTGNKSESGGAVMNAGGTVELKGGSDFKNNTSTKSGGAVYNWNNATATLEGDTSFSGNNAVNGGAVFNESMLKIDNGNVSFSDNEASKSGGAVYNSGTANIESEETDFSNNTSTDMGGAVYNEGTLTNVGHITFVGNKSESGGAVMNAAGTLELKGGSDFKNNTSTKGGGALYNWQKGTVTLEGETNFTDNVAEGANGGAIYNAAESNIHIKGNAVFSGNRVNGVNGEYNDIYNDGNIDVSEDSTLTLDGGVTGSGNLTFEDGSALVAKVGKTTITNHVTNKGAELTLVMENGFEGGTVDLIGEGGSLDQDFELKNSNTFYDFNQSDKTGSYEVSKKSTEDLKDMLHADANEAAAARALIYGRASEDNQTFNDMADAVFAKLQSPDTIQEGLDDVAMMSPEVADLVQQEQTAVSNQIFGAVGSRLSSGTASSWRGMSSGDDPFRDVTVWAQLLDNHAELDETSGVHGWDSDTYGIALGLEKKINPFFKAGIGYAYGKTDIDGFRRQTDIYTNTGMLYGEYKPSNWFVNGIFSYGWSDYKEKKSIADYLVRAKYDVNSLGMQVMTGYEFWAPYGVKFVPELGMRYLYLDQNDYTDSMGIRITGRTSDVLTAVFGAKISQPWVVGYRTIITPELRIATTYDMKRPDADSVVSLPNGQSYEVSGRPMKRLGVEIGAGVTAEVNDKTDVSANYEGHFRDHYQDHTGLLGVKYKI